MSEPLPAVSPKLYAAHGVFWIGTALLLALAGVVAFSWWDASKVAERERFEEVTAVGDVEFFTAAPAAAAVLTAEGKSWAIADEKSLRDPRMIRAARDESRGVTLYRPRKEPKSGELFVKVARNKYVRLVPVK